MCVHKDIYWYLLISCDFCQLFTSSQLDERNGNDVGTSYDAKKKKEIAEKFSTIVS